MLTTNHGDPEEYLLPAVVGQAQKSDSMKGNPITLTNEELAGVLMAAI